MTERTVDSAGFLVEMFQLCRLIRRVYFVGFHVSMATKTPGEA